MQSFILVELGTLCILTVVTANFHFITLIFVYTVLIQARFPGNLSASVFLFWTATSQMTDNAQLILDCLHRQFFGTIRIVEDDKFSLVPSSSNDDGFHNDILVNGSIMAFPGNLKYHFNRLGAMLPVSRPILPLIITLFSHAIVASILGNGS